MSVAHAAISPQRALLIRAEQIHTLYMQLPKSSAGIITGGFIVGGAMWQQVSHLSIGLWIAFMILNQSWRLYLYHRYRQVAPPPEQAQRWGLYWAIGAGISGCIWGAAGIFMYVHDSPDHQALLVIALFGVTAGAATLISLHMPSFYAFVLPTLMPLLARLALEADSTHLFMAAVGSLVLVVICAFGRSLNQVFTQSLNMRYENIELIAELTEQTRVADQARQEAETATRAKSQFLAAASHDLRQPLHAMGLFAAALSEKNRSPEELELVRSINASVVALETLFNELLDISKLDSGVIRPQLSHFQLQPLFDHLRVEYQPEAAEKQLELRIRPTRAVLHTDRVLLERILRNLVSNAIRYTSAGGILLACRRRGDKLRIEVWDTGIGIAPQEMSRIFEEFYQIGDSARHSKKGLGLGLAIIRRLSALLDFAVDLKSRPGRGSVFSVLVPPGNIAPAPDEMPAPPVVAAEGLKGRLVVVIDDEESILAGMQALLMRWGCDVVVASGTDEALSALGALERYPDLIIADYRLQDGETGIRSIAQLRDELGTRCPAIVATGSITPDLAVDAARDGFTLINKPVIPDRLHALISGKLDRTP